MSFPIKLKITETSDAVKKLIVKFLQILPNLANNYFKIYRKNVVKVINFLKH